MRNWLRKFFASRYGFDALNYTLLLLAAGLIALTFFVDSQVPALGGCILIVWALCRAASGNLNRRWQENVRFTSVFSRLRSRRGRQAERRQQRKEYRFFACPGCKNRLRVPRGKGKIQITCPRCGQRFTKKT